LWRCFANSQPTGSKPQLSSNAHEHFVPSNFPFRFDSIDGLRHSCKGDTGKSKQNDDGSNTKSTGASNTAEEKDGLAISMKRYGITKMANVLFAAELQRRLDSDPDLVVESPPGKDGDGGRARIISTAVHPGGVATEGAIALFPGVVGALLKRFYFVPPHEGAWPSLFAATAPEVRENAEKYAGKYLVPPAGKIGGMHVAARGEMGAKNAADLWHTTEEAVRRYLDAGPVQ